MKEYMPDFFNLSVWYNFYKKIICVADVVTIANAPPHLPLWLPWCQSKHKSLHWSHMGIRYFLPWRAAPLSQPAKTPWQYFVLSSFIFPNKEQQNIWEGPGNEDVPCIYFLTWHLSWKQRGLVVATFTAMVLHLLT